MVHFRRPVRIQVFVTTALGGRRPDTEVFLRTLEPPEGLLDRIARFSRGTIPEVVTVPTEVQVAARRPIELPDPTVAVLAVDHSRAPEPGALPAEVTRRRLDRNRVFVALAVVRPTVDHCIGEDHLPRTPVADGSVAKARYLFAAFGPLDASRRPGVETALTV